MGRGKFDKEDSVWSNSRVNIKVFLFIVWVKKEKKKKKKVVLDFILVNCLVDVRGIKQLRINVMCLHGMLSDLMFVICPLLMICTLFIEIDKKLMLALRYSSVF